MVPARNLLHHRRRYYHDGSYCYQDASSLVTMDFPAEEGDTTGTGGAGAGAGEGEEGEAGTSGDGNGGDEGWLQLGTGKSKTTSPEKTKPAGVSGFFTKGASSSSPAWSFPVAGAASVVSALPSAGGDVVGVWNAAGAGTSSSSPFLPTPPSPFLPTPPSPFNVGSGSGGGGGGGVYFPVVGTEDVESPAAARVVAPPPSRRENGLWFCLRASENQSREPFLPQLTKNYLRIKDGSMTVRLLMRYLVGKLGLAEESEVEITCRGRQLQPHLSLQHVRDHIWCAGAGDYSTTGNHVMTLEYGRATVVVHGGSVSHYVN